MRVPLPLLAVGLGLAGLIPFAGCGYFAVSAAEPGATSWLYALIFYAAVILSFLGGVHWGFALSDARKDLAPDRDTAPHNQWRLGLGVLPSLIGWAAACLTLWQGPNIGLGVLITGFAVTLLAETGLQRGALLPQGYIWLRWTLSLLAITVLVAVLVLRLTGKHIALG